jgi:ribosomal protein S13
MKAKKKIIKKKAVPMSLTNIHGIGASLSKSSSPAIRKVAAKKLSLYGWKVTPKRKK